MCSRVGLISFMSRVELYRTYRDCRYCPQKKSGEVSCVRVYVGRRKEVECGVAGVWRC